MLGTGGRPPAAVNALVFPDKPGLRSPSYAGTPQAAPVNHHHMGLIAFLLGPKVYRKRRSNLGRTGSGLSRALPYSSQVFRALSSAAAALSALGSTGESHMDPGCYLNTEHAGRF